jgi:hypothetical protein
MLIKSELLLINKKIKISLLYKNLSIHLLTALIVIDDYINK